MIPINLFSLKFINSCLSAGISMNILSINSSIFKVFLEFNLPNNEIEEFQKKIQNLKVGKYNQFEVNKLQ